MTYAHTAHAPATGAAGFFATLRETIATHARKTATYHRILRELDQMTDRDLADIGIARFMITDIAKEAAAQA